MSAIFRHSYFLRASSSQTLLEDVVTHSLMRLIVEFSTPFDFSLRQGFDLQVILDLQHHI